MKENSFQGYDDLIEEVWLAFIENREQFNDTVKAEQVDIRLNTGKFLQWQQSIQSTYLEADQDGDGKLNSTEGRQFIETIETAEKTKYATTLGDIEKLLLFVDNMADGTAFDFQQFIDVDKFMYQLAHVRDLAMSQRCT